MLRNEARELLVQGYEATHDTVERAIDAMGYTLKKKSFHASGRDRIRCAGRAQGMGRDHKA